MTLGFERNGVKYLATSCVDDNNSFSKEVKAMKENYPIEIIDKFDHTAVSVHKSTYDLFNVVDVLESLEEDELNVNILHDKVMPKIRELELKGRGINNELYLNSSVKILHNHRFYLILTSGIVDVQDEIAFSNSTRKSLIASEFITLNKDLDYKETILAFDKFLVQMNYGSLLPYVVYKEDTDTIELVGENI